MACNCCVVFKPRYKRLVDSIYPPDANQGLVKSNMDKLTFFAMKSPDKLDRIGEYLAQKLSRDISRGRHGYVRVAVEALDILLLTCHPPSLNMFAESFLKMVQKLLECDDQTLQQMASQSFVKFSNIEEDTPSYHRRYDFFVSKFSSMCHDKNDTADGRSGQRLAGLRGLQGVVRKTVSDDLQCNIWKSTHMDKIVPSLLFNMHEEGRAGGRGFGTSSNEPESPRDEDKPGYISEAVFRDLVGRATYGSINAVINPVLQHLDNHKAWVPNDFGVHCFKVIMFSAPTQYGYIVVQMLMAHLDHNAKNDAKIRISIVEVLLETILIAAGGSIGPSVLDVFNTLLKHLRLSVDATSGSRASVTTSNGGTAVLSDEQRFQEAIVNTIGEFANNLPDYQKIEIMMFVISKVPMPNEDTDRADVVHLQMMLLKALLKVAARYKTVLLTNALPSAFLDPLQRMSLSPDAGIRRIVQEILHNLLDRHGNLEKLRAVQIDAVNRFELTMEAPPRQDLVFMKKNSTQIFTHLYENAQQLNNKVDNYERLYTTMALLCVEVGAGGGDEMILEQLRLALNIQNSTLNSRLPITHRCAIHALIAAYLSLISQLLAISPLSDHVNTVINARRNAAKCYLPDIAFCRTNTSGIYPETSVMQPEWLFNAETIGSAVGVESTELSRLAGPYTARPTSLGLNDQLTRSVSDIQSLILETDSAASTPGPSRRSLGLLSNAEETTFESMKRTLESDPKAKEEERKRQQKIYETFRSGPFEELVSRTEKKSVYQSRLSELLSVSSEHPQPRDDESTPDLTEMDNMGKDSTGDIQYPQLFVY